MIQLTRLNGEKFQLNACMIEQIRSNPDTTITLVNGKKLVVQELEANVVESITVFYQKIGFNGWLQKASDRDEQ